MAKETHIHDRAEDEIRDLRLEEDIEIDERGVADTMEFLRRVGVFEDAFALMDEIQKAA